MQDVLTSLESVLEGESIEDPETFLCASGEATLILVEPDEHNFSLLIGIHYIIIQD